MAKAKAIKDINGQHARLYYSIANSPAWCALSPSAKALWCDMRVQVGATNNGAATTALAILKHKGWSSRHTIARARNELICLGFIELTVQGGICNGGKTPNLYRFTDLPMYELPKHRLARCNAVHLYRKFGGLSEAKGALRAARLESNKVKVNKLHSLSVANAPELQNLGTE